MTTESEDPRRGLPSASKLARLIQCPGSEQRIRSIPPSLLVRSSKDDELADMGTRIHKSRELRSDANLLDDQERDLFSRGMKYEKDLLEGWMSYYGLSSEQVTEGPAEKRMWLTDPDDPLMELASGQLDVHYLAPPYALVIDWKSLWCTYLPETNHSAQLRLQALLLWQNRTDQDVSIIRTAYDKPMIYKGGVDDFTDYQESDLQYALRLTMHQLWSAKQPGAPIYHGPECRYCPAAQAGVCREAAAWGMLPSVMKEGTQTVLAPVPDAVVERMTPEDLVKVWRYKPLLEKIMDMAVARLKGMSDQELLELGLERAKGRKLDPIVDVVGAFDFLLSQGWDRDRILRCMGFSKTKLVEDLMEREGLAQKWAQQRMEEDMGLFIEPKIAEPSLKMFKGITK